MVGLETRGGAVEVGGMGGTIDFAEILVGAG